MDLKAIQYVSEIVRCGSMTKAAASLSLSQPALSQYVYKLEEGIGCRLFERVGNRLQLTNAGEVFVKEGISIISAYDTMLDHVRTAAAQSENTVRMGISLFYSRFFLPPLQEKLKDRCPEIRLEVIQESSLLLLELVRNGMLDFCIKPFSDVTDGCILEPILNEEIMVAVPRGSLASMLAYSTEEAGDGFRTLPLESLSEYPFIMMKKTQTFSRLGYNYCASAGFVPRVACELTSWDSINALIGRGAGVGFVPRELALTTEGPETPEYFHFHSPLGNTRPFVFARKEGSFLTQSASSVLRLIREIVESEGFIF